jgi:ubiquinone/menaquinone biosynthesis C-methylase UbiE
VTHQERHAKGHQHLIPHLFRAAAIGPGDRVLDIGCGCGGTTIAAARAAAGTGQPGSDPARPEPDPARPEPVPARPEPVPARPEPGPARPEPGRGSAAAARNGSAFGLDLSGPMLAVARQLAADADLANVVFEQGDAQVYPLPRGHYDVMISSFGVMFFDDAAAAFANIVAALRDRGRLAFLCWQDDLRNELFSIPLRAFGARTPPLPSASGLFADPRQVTELLSGAGCADIQVSPLTEPAWMGTDVADVMAYVREMSMVTRLVAELGDQARAEQALAAMAEQYAARQRPDGVWVATAAWLVTARRG